LHVLVDWIAKRYTRPAFPDAFNERRAGSAKKIGKELKKNGKLITGIFLFISPNEECAAGESYQVVLRVGPSLRRRSTPDLTPPTSILRSRAALLSIPPVASKRERRRRRRSRPLHGYETTLLQALHGRLHRPFR
jgi:hypothetical protein